MHSVIIAGGGTGGHIFPALAIADEIKKRYPQCHIHFVGAIGRMEMEKVPQAGYQITGLPMSGIQRKQLLKNWNLPFKIFKSLLLSNKILREKKPEIVIGVGGYASAAIVKRAQSIGIPTLLQEQNGYAGVTNKLLGKSANAICVAYERMERFFPEPLLHLTGNPVREQITQPIERNTALYKKYDLEENKPVLLFIGGSLGARSINIAVENNCKYLLQKGFQIIWQTGKNYNTTTQLPGMHVQTFIQEMNEVYSLADIIISRAGAISISELCCIGKPCILVPSPNVAEDHQTRNAAELVRKNAVVLIPDNEISGSLVENCLELWEHEDYREKLSKNIVAMAKPNAVQDIVSIIEDIVNPK